MTWEFKLFIWDKSYYKMPKLGDQKEFESIGKAMEYAYVLYRENNKNPITYATLESSIYYVTSKINSKFRKND